MTTIHTFPTRVVVRPHAPIYVPAERTVLDPQDDANDWTMETEVALCLVEDTLGRRIIRVAGGPTGREAVELTPGNVETLKTRSWVANRGVRGQCDRLVITSNEMRKALSKFGVTVEQVEAAA